MSIVLPGETVPAQHVNLKLGPGLQQLSNAEGSTSVLSTRAGELQHSANGSKWWVESNARRVGVFHPLPSGDYADYFYRILNLVCASATGISGWRRDRKDGRGVPSGYWRGSSRISGWAGVRRGQQAESANIEGRHRLFIWCTSRS